MPANHYHLAVQDRPLPEWSNLIRAKSGLACPCGDADSSSEFDIPLLFGGKVIDVGKDIFGGRAVEFRLPSYCNFGQESYRFRSGKTQKSYSGQEKQVACNQGDDQNSFHGIFLSGSIIAQR